MASEFKLTRRVEFSETDMAGVMHFSNFFRYMEAVEHAFVRSLGFSVMTQNTDPALPMVGWPRVAVSCEYFRPLRFEDEVEVHLMVEKKNEKSVTYVCEFRKVGDATVRARGSMTVVCCTIRAGKMQATFMPKEFADKIEVSKQISAVKTKR